MFLSSNRISPTHSKYFDMWRGGASIVVAAAHTVQIFGASYPSFYGRLFSALAGAAVMAFFALSGFFIHKSLARCYGDSLNWRSFLKSRADRILPPFVACLALTVILWAIAPQFFASGTRDFITPTDRSGYSLDGLWLSMFFVNNFFGPALSANGPLWSLTYEVWYYVLACLFSMAILGQRRAWIALPILVLLTLLDVWFAILGLVWLGGFYISILHAKDCLPKLPNFPISLVPIALLVAVLLAPDSLVGKASILFRLAFGFWMVFHMAHMLNQVSVPEIRLLAWSGSFSYSLYVFHFPILLFSYGIYEGAGLLVLSFILGFSALIGPSLEKLRIPSVSIPD